MRTLGSLIVGVAISSLAIAAATAGPQPIGAVSAITNHERGIQIACTDGANVAVSFLAPDLVRVRTLFAGQSADPDHSWAIARTQWDAVAWKLTEGPDTITTASDELEVVVRRHPLLVEFRDARTHRTINADVSPMARDPESGRLVVAKKLGFDEHFYGLGEKAARLDKRRGKFEMWNSDTPGYVEGTDPIYQSIPFYLGLESGRGYGIFYDNSHRSTFDLGREGQDAAIYSADGGVLDLYFFFGPSLKKIVGRYADLTGHMPLPPLWALGNQQSRYSYYPDTMVEEIATTYREHDLPLDVLYLDIHYMRGYRVFTWDPARFPDPAAMMKRLGERGVKVVTIVDPGVKFEPGARRPEVRDQGPEGGSSASENQSAIRSPQSAIEQKSGGSYSVFDDGLAKDFFLRRRDGSLYVGEVWPGKSVFVDYTREDARRWWGDQHRALLDPGVAGIWTDMNEPSDFVDKTGASQADVVFDDVGAHSLYAKNRNVFALNMARATYEGLERLRPTQRPFVITRAGYAGVQRYSTVWTGDNNATFEALALNIPMFASLGLSGEPFVGADVPGFIGRGDGELLARSYQVAFLVPLCRNHTAIDIYDHEPWRFGPRYETIVRKYLKLRYRLLPFLYTTLEEAHRTGLPLFRPLVLNFQDDADTLNLDDEFMIGDALLAAPVLRANERARDVYLPQGRWYDFWSSSTVVGGGLLRVDAPIDHIPLYIRGGSIVPSTQTMNFVGEKPWDPLRFDIYPDETGSAAGSLYEDDGNSPDYKSGAFRRTTLHVGRSAAGVTQLVLAAPTGNFRTPVRQFEFAFHGIASPRDVLVDGKATTAATGDNAAIVVRFADDGAAHQIELR